MVGKIFHVLREEFARTHGQQRRRHQRSLRCHLLNRIHLIGNVGIGNAPHLLAGDRHIFFRVLRAAAAFLLKANPATTEFRLAFDDRSYTAMRALTLRFAPAIFALAAVARTDARCDFQSRFDVNKAAQNAVKEQGFGVVPTFEGS